MNKYAIVTDSCSDLNKEYRKEHNIPYAKMFINWEDEKGSHEEIADMDWKVLSMKEFYDIIRKGIRIRTSQTTVENYLETFEPILKEGKDVLYLACSSGLSASLNVARMLADGELKAKYPNNKLVVIDTLRAGMAQGLIVHRAINLQKEGKSIDEVASIIESEKLKYKEVGIPDTLLYLKRAGRVSAGAAFFGNVVGLKPILQFNDQGVNEAVEKAIGKKAAFKKMAEIIQREIEDPENQEIYLMHADCKQEDIDNFKKAILEINKVKNIIVEPLGPIIGASSGPGTIIVNYRGK